MAQKYNVADTDYMYMYIGLSVLVCECLSCHFSKSHEVAAQMKLLADAPEKIWRCLEEQSYLKAAQYFLLSRHIFSRLELSGAGSSVVKRLWHSVSSFKETIMEVSVLVESWVSIEVGNIAETFFS